MTLTKGLFLKCKYLIVHKPCNIFNQYYGFYGFGNIPKERLVVIFIIIIVYNIRFGTYHKQMF